MFVNYAVYATLSLKKNKNFTSNAMAQKRKIVLHRRTKYSLGRAQWHQIVHHSLDTDTSPCKIGERFEQLCFLPPRINFPGHALELNKCIIICFLLITLTTCGGFRAKKRSATSSYAIIIIIFNRNDVLLLRMKRKQ